MALQIGDRVEIKRARRDGAIFRWALGAGRSAAFGLERKRRQAVRELPRMPLWVAARVYAGFEFAVADALTVEGFFGYAPHKTRMRPKARVAGSSWRRQAVEVDYPMLAGYVLVGCPAGRYIARGDLIREVLGDALGRPGLAQKTVDDLNRIALRVDPADAGVAIGDRVDAEVSGVTIRGVVSALRKAGVVVDVAMFGGLTPVEVGVDKVSRVSL